MKSLKHFISQLDEKLSETYLEKVDHRSKSIVHERFLKSGNGDITNDQPKARLTWMDIARGLTTEASIVSINGKPFVKDPTTGRIDIADVVNKLKILAAAHFRKNNQQVDLDKYSIVGQAWNDVQMESDPKTGDLSAQKLSMLLMKNEQLLNPQQQAEQPQNQQQRKAPPSLYDVRHGAQATAPVQSTLAPTGRV